MSAREKIESNLPFCAGVQFSRNGIRAFNERKYEKIEGCEQSIIFFVLNIPTLIIHTKNEKIKIKPRVI